MADDSDKDSKTEEPTGKRLSDARQKGQVANSKEVTTAFMFLAATGLFYFQGDDLWMAMQTKMRFFFSGSISSDLNSGGLVLLLRSLITEIIMDLSSFFLVFVVMAILSSIIQNGFLISFESIAPKLSKINPINGFKRLFSVRSLVELVKSILKMGIISLVVYWAIKDNFGRTVSLTATNMDRMVEVMGEEVIVVMSVVTLTFVAMGFLDLLYQKYEHIVGLRMTKQEVKDEQKQMEGDPLVKGRIRQIQREMAQRRMMEEVPKADVVITNPTHFAVALCYKQGEMRAPMVVAKGRGRVALRIRDTAKENKVPLVENPPLARTLFQDVDMGQVIPPELFKAVAEVLAYVFSLRQ